MNIIKELLLNQLIKIPVIEKIAKKKHSTGRNNNPIEIKKVFEKISQNVIFENTKVLELGPGHTFGVLELVRKSKAAMVCAIDITNYSDNIPIGIEFKLYDGGLIPYKNETFDVLFSWSVFEHIRLPNTTVHETHRILKKGGIAIHSIDLVDHFNYSWKKDKLIFNCLRYNVKLWNLMTWNRSNYVNRLRLSDWQNLFNVAGFDVEYFETTESKIIESLYLKNKIKYLSKYTLNDAKTTSVYFVLKKR